VGRINTVVLRSLRASESRKARAMTVEVRELAHTWVSQQQGRGSIMPPAYCWLLTHSCKRIDLDPSPFQAARDSRDA
jgi:hypothetical protein